MADHLELPAYWNGHRARVGGTRHRARLTCDRLESRDTAVDLIGDPLSDSLGELARLLGDGAFRDASIRTSRPAGPIAEIADESPRTRARYDTWLDPHLLFPEERADHGVRITAPTAPADPGRGMFTGLLGEQPQPTGPNYFGSFPSFVGVRVTPIAQASGVADGPSEFGSRAPFPTMTVMASGGEGLPGLAPVVVGEIGLTEEDDPNAPVAVYDTVTVDEDGSVAFDPIANDTDADVGDELSLADWDVTPAHGLVLREADGRLKYTPDPDYNGPDTISYTVTDGIKEAIGTITVTVDPVNDPVYAFDDAYQVYRPEVSELPPDQLTVWSGVGTEVPVLANDYDADGEDFTAVPGDVPVYDGSGYAAGTAHLEDDGSFQWEMPRDFFGKASFQYQATDGMGSTVTATAWMWALHVAGSTPTIGAAPDRYFVGDDPLQADPVTANDAGAGLAIIETHPLTGRVVSFDNGGKFEYQPGLATGDEQFSYAIYSTDGRGLVPEVSVDLNRVRADIYHGQYGPKVEGQLEQKIGAFTVANKNDSDYDVQIDATDNNGVAPRAGMPAGFEGGEVDLMKFDLHWPNDPNAGANAAVEIKVAAGTGVKLWTGKYKNPAEAIALTNSAKSYGKADFPANGPLTVWVELTEPSATVGDVKLDVTYDPAVAGRNKATVTQLATGIWVEGQNQSEGDPLNPANAWQGATFYNANPAAWPDDANKPLTTTHQEVNNSQLGQKTNEMLSKGGDGVAGTGDDEVRTFNAALMQFRFVTDGLAQLAPGFVRIDIGRTMTARVKQIGPDEAGPPFTLVQELSTPWTWGGVTWLDVVNDDGVLDGDEDTDLHYKKDGQVMRTRNVYSMDGPGMGIEFRDVAADVSITQTEIPLREYIMQFNAFEFVRIKIGEAFNENEGTVEGSRSSVYFYWHSRLDVESVPAPGKAWREWSRVGPAGDNSIGTGHKAFTI